MADKIAELEKLETIIKRDLRNLQILNSDVELDMEIFPACDCSDLIEFLHIPDPSVEQEKDAYREGIRRYFVSCEKIILVPVK